MLNICLPVALCTIPQASLDMTLIPVASTFQPLLITLFPLLQPSHIYRPCLPYYSSGLLKSSLNDILVSWRLLTGHPTTANICASYHSPNVKYLVRNTMLDSWQLLTLRDITAVQYQWRFSSLFKKSPAIFYKHFELTVLQRSQNYFKAPLGDLIVCSLRILLTVDRTPLFNSTVIKNVSPFKDIFSSSLFLYSSSPFL